MFKKYAVIAIFAFFLISIASCGKKDENTDINKTDTSKISQIIKKDSVTGKDKVLFKYTGKPGDKLFYKLVAKISDTQNNPETKGQDLKNDNESIFYYWKEVESVDDKGVITFSIKIDSIIEKQSLGEQSITYNSNVYDTVRSSQGSMFYNALIYQPFKIRQSPDGKVTDIFALENVYDNLFKILGDTIDEKQKEGIKSSLSMQSVKDFLQSELQIFSKDYIQVDSSWQFSQDGQVFYFNIKNNIKYILKSIDNVNGQYIANIDGIASTDFLEKEVKDKSGTARIDESNSSGTGTVKINLSRGCVQTKETTINVYIAYTISSGGQSAKVKRNVTQNFSVTLLN
ncbi:MAG: hypothetical protein EHM58_14745 [Ignavibacteriae bacterium]|nr:MAG: hypothetical protein EHM58_14745 [Ignavibacteriota bacterium]